MVTFGLLAAFDDEGRVVLFCDFAVFPALSWLQVTVVPMTSRKECSLSISLSGLIPSAVMVIWVTGLSNASDCVSEGDANTTCLLDVALGGVFCVVVVAVDDDDDDNADDDDDDTDDDDADEDDAEDDDDNDGDDDDCDDDDGLSLDCGC